MRSSRELSVALAILFAVARPWEAAADHLPAHREGAEHAPVSHRAKPDFLIEAEENYAEAEAAVRTEQRALEQLRDEEARLRRASLAKTGSWIEPAELWRKKQALLQSIASRKEVLLRAKAKLNVARTRLRAGEESGWTVRHRPSWFGSWWQW